MVRTEASLCNDFFLLLRSQPYLCGSPFFFFLFVPSYISGVHHSSSSSSALPSYISEVHHSSSSSAFPAISLRFIILLLLLRSQVYLWGSSFFFFFFCAPQLYLRGSPFFFFCDPNYISAVHHLLRFFACVTVFNPTIEVVTFRLPGWCMLGVFALPAITRLSHECQDLLNPCNGMHVRTN